MLANALRNKSNGVRYLLKLQAALMLIKIDICEVGIKILTESIIVITHIGWLGVGKNGTAKKAKMLTTY